MAGGLHRPADPSRRRGCRSSLHLLGGPDPHDIEAVADNLPYCRRQFQPCACQIGITRDDEAKGGVVMALIVLRMERCSEIAEIESDAVRLMRERGTFDNTRKLRSHLYQSQFILVEQVAPRLDVRINTG